MNAESRKLLKRWARKGLIVYIRPYDAGLADPRRKGKVEWIVQVTGRTTVESRNVSLNAAVADVSAKLPRPRKKVKGWLDPKLVKS